MLDEAISHLIRSKLFYAHIAIGMRKRFTNNVPTAGVNITDKVNLYINPAFWMSMSPIEQAGVIEHEINHCLFNHFKRREHRNHRLYNIAADMAINQLIKDLPREIKAFDKNGQPLIDPKTGLQVTGKTVHYADYNFPEGLTSEDYYELLLHQKDQNKDKEYEPGSDTLDDHGIWDENIDNAEVIEEKLKNLIKPAMEAAKKAGGMPLEIEKLIEKLFNKPKDWRKDLQHFAAKASSSIRQSTRKRRNRRYGILYPGHKRLPKLRLAVPVDTSGSVSHEEQNQFMAEIHKIYEMGADIFIIEADAGVHAVYEYDPKKAIKFHGGGGTNFKPSFDEANKLDVDGLIYLTDGEDYGPMAERPKYPVIWALVRNKEIRYPWGYKTFVEVNKK